MLVVMAGLPGSGKTTIAARLAEALPALIIDKDTVRAGLFPPEAIEYSTHQDDFVVDIMLRVARFCFEQNPRRILILDGRPYSRRYQLERVTRFADRIGRAVKLIVCTCSESTARARLERAAADGTHVAANRDFGLYRRIQAAQEPYGFPHLLVDTDRDLPSCVRQCLDYIQTRTRNQNSPRNP